ncbi:LuxR C-terminal-related transcriptional regulator [Kitasatospora sp. NPDC101176]|uniref:helix-turn-helix transcriptional regulator n=1 Tax=Kitasatospora sp. NPDC101176 TaxID=3364099 RepID=UPI0037F6EE15
MDVSPQTPPHPPRSAATGTGPGVDPGPGPGALDGAVPAALPVPVPVPVPVPAPAPEPADGAAYAWVLEHGSLDAAALAAHLTGLGLDPDGAAPALERLLAWQLVHRDPDDPRLGRAVAPEAAMAALADPVEAAVRRSRAELAHRQALVAGFLPVHRQAVAGGNGAAGGDAAVVGAAIRAAGGNAAAGGDAAVVGAADASAADAADGPATDAPGADDPPQLQVIATLPEVRAALDRASAECRSEVLTSQPGGGSRVPAAMEDALRRDRVLLARGVRMRTLYHHTARFNGPSQAYVEAATALGAEYRTAHELFGRLIVFDRELAFLPLDDGSWGALVVRQKALVAYLCEIFEQTWTLARPFAEAAEDGFGQVAQELDQTIVRMLAAGLKDEAIARRLGMSLRTARRHIADIMDELAADSRFQAGVAAARAGLLDD